MNKLASIAKIVAWLMVIFVIIEIAVIALPKYRSKDHRVEQIESLEATIDSIENFWDNHVPDTIIRDSLIYRDTVIYKVTEKPVPVYIESSGLNTYEDSIVNEEINVRVKVDGTYVERIRIGYEPIITVQQVMIEKPVPVIRKEYVPVPQKGFYWMGGVGNAFSAEAFYINENSNVFGAELGYAFGKPTFEVKFGKKF